MRDEVRRHGHREGPDLPWLIKGVLAWAPRRQFGHERLSTFGIGAHFSEPQLRGVLRQLIATGALAA